MVSITEIETATDILEKSLQNTVEDRERWLRGILLQREPNQQVQILSKRREPIGQILGWERPGRRVIPSEKIPNFILENLSIDFLKIEEVRRVLLSSLLISEPHKFEQLRMLMLPDVVSPDPITDISKKEFKIGTSISKEYCRILGLPESFSSRGSSDNRPGMEIIKPVKKIPQMVDFQKRVMVLTHEILPLENGRAMIVMPTGSGKTRTSIESTLGWLFLNNKWPSRLIWIADREELCEQAFQSFKEIFVHLYQDLEGKVNLPNSMKILRYWGGLDSNDKYFTDPDENYGIIVTSIQQLQARIRNSSPVVEKILETPSIVIVDEAHRNLDFVEELDYKFSTNICNTRMIGLTATPMRSERRESSRLIELFHGNVICPIDGGEHDVDVMIEELTDIKILSKRIDVNPSECINLESLVNLRGESAYLEKILQIIYDIKERNRESILVFTRDVEHARVLSTILRLNNDKIRSQYLDSNTPSEQRKDIIRQFKNKEIEVLFNFGILTTGFDAPNTDAVIICRQLEKSSSLFRQMVGRGLRGSKFGGTEDCIIVHFEEDING